MKDTASGKGAIANLYGGTALLNRYDILMDADKKSAESNCNR